MLKVETELHELGWMLNGVDNLCKEVALEVQTELSKHKEFRTIESQKKRRTPAKSKARTALEISTCAQSGQTQKQTGQKKQQQKHKQKQKQNPSTQACLERIKMERSASDRTCLGRAEACRNFARTGKS